MKHIYEKHREDIFLFALIFFLVSRFLFAETMWIDRLMPITSLIKKGLYVMALGIFLCMNIWILYKEEPRKRVIIIASYLVVIASAIQCREEMVLVSILLLISVKDVDLRKTIKAYFYTSVICLFLSITGCLLGLVENVSQTWHYGTGYAWGKWGPNMFGLYLMSTTLAWLYLNSSRSTFVKAAVSWGMSCFVYMVPRCRTCAILLFLYPIAEVIWSLLKKRKIRLVKKMAIVLPCIFLALSIAMMFSIDKIQRLDGNIRGRFVSALAAFREYGVRLFGYNIPIGESIVSEKLCIPAMDNAYLYLLLIYGIVLTILYIMVYMFIIWKCECRNEDALLVIGVMFLIFGLMEQTMLYPHLNFMWMACLARFSDSSKLVKGLLE